MATLFLAAGTALTAYSTIQAGQAAAAGAAQQQYASEVQRQGILGQQAVAEYNARVAEQSAQSIELATQYRQRRQSEAAARHASTLLAGMGASGVRLSEGAPLMIQTTQAAEAGLDDLMLGYEGQIQASRARSQGAIDRLQGDVYAQQAILYKRKSGAYGQQAKSAQTAGYIGAGQTLLSGFSAYQRWQ